MVGTPRRGVRGGFGETALPKSRRMQAKLKQIKHLFQVNPFDFLKLSELGRILRKNNEPPGEK